jgi:hypothetical protein
MCDDSYIVVDVDRLREHMLRITSQLANTTYYFNATLKNCCSKRGVHSTSVGQKFRASAVPCMDLDARVLAR